MKQLLGGALLLMLFTGCVRWTHPKKPADEYWADKNECGMQAAQAFPPGVVVPPFATQERCNRDSRNAGCQPIENRYDPNAGARDSATKQCLRDRGWR